MKKIYRHYGAGKFDPTHELSTEKRKPDGLFACPKRTAWEWVECLKADWCGTLYPGKNADSFFDFRLKKGTKILRLHNLRDIAPYLKADENYMWFKNSCPDEMEKDITLGMTVDMDKLKRHFDGIEVYLNNKTCGELTLSYMFSMYETDTLIIWNLDRVVEVA